MNLLTKRQAHALYCEDPGDMRPSVGDVRRCQHGHIQMAWSLPGFGQCHWFDINPLSLTYWRARRALRGADQ